ncbi:MAG: UDP-3-O-(3-hydroxymyristoyl)glucosamine N-acyltransferase [Bacteroidota bacterium]|nr:UDP-3-O-(3-hydroxymyristoyl)glucosamine N-acyltransferase [Bacteroidota bacterium]MDX5429830.1 UDP-3-O-(3-hydroxymyristoyl)glucosamine N-acyltransferase [Bacteroidota bacterium]MDX5468609.1 UDP-3-O-(3-hydroxymyristoyl)glucosamine N-acyltransferase [Bacteroidota bacterium]
MKFPRNYSLQELAQLIQAKLVGPSDFVVSGLNEIHMVESGDLTFVNVEKYYNKALGSAATTILIDKEVECPEGKTLLISDDPFRDYTFLAKYFRPTPIPVNSRYDVGEDSVIGEGTLIHHGVVIGNQVKIGKNCIIYPNVVIYDHTEIGDNVIIHSNSSIGSDAFYYSNFQKMHTCGRAILKDWVEIGANCSIDRGVSGDTVIGAYTKFDNQVHIGHDTVVGERCIFAAQVGVAGVTKIEDRVVLWGKVGVTKDIVIGEGAMVMATSGVSKSLEPGKVYFGSPAKENRKILREMAALGRLPDLMDELRKKGF